MGRPRRRTFGGIVYHVVNRGNERARIFNSDSDFKEFLGLMNSVAAAVPVRVVGYDIMPNHWHLMLWPEADDCISSYMHRLTSTHALQHRRKEGTLGAGHLYQGRFKCIPVQSEAYYYTCLKYVEDNSRRAGLVTRAEQWRWSSIHERLHGGMLLSPGPLSLPTNWTEIVNIGPTTAELKEIRVCARAERPLGAAEWVDRAVAQHGLEANMRPRGRPRRK
jgi:putative transposase